jgi:hypothetical protein
MEEMEAQIEKEMLSQAATKIQAGFRGFKTRKSIRHSGVSFAENTSGGPDNVPAAGDCLAPLSPSVTEAAIEPAAATTSAFTAEKSFSTELPDSGGPTISDGVSSLPVDSQRDHQGSLPPERSASFKPPLAAFRSRSYPGSAEGDKLMKSQNPGEHETEVELLYDPDYMNNAATVIQATIRGYLVRNRNRRRNDRNNISGDKQDDEYEDIIAPIGNQYGGLIVNPADRDSMSPVSGSCVIVFYIFRSYVTS